MRNRKKMENIWNGARYLTFPRWRLHPWFIDPSYFWHSVYRTSCDTDQREFGEIYKIYDLTKAVRENGFALCIKWILHESNWVSSREEGAETIELYTLIMASNVMVTKTHLSNEI